MGGFPLREIVFLVSGLLGFLFWPAWIVTGIAFLTMQGGNSTSSTASRLDGIEPTRPQRSSLENALELSRSKNAFRAVGETKTSTSTSVQTPSPSRPYPDLAKLGPPVAKSVGKRLLPESGTSQQASHVQPVVKKAPSGRLAAPMRIAAVAHERRIKHLVHFTRCENIGSILERGLMSVDDLEMDRMEAVRNDVLRLDGKNDGVSLSVSFPNYKMFYKYRCERPNADWAVFLLNPAILWELDCGFYAMNAADHRMRHRPLSDAKGAEAFDAMFDDSAMHRDPRLRSCDPTDAQAEVMAFEPIDPSYILSVAFESAESSNRWGAWTGTLDTTVQGRGRGVFGPRELGIAN